MDHSENKINCGGTIQWSSRVGGLDFGVGLHCLASTVINDPERILDVGLGQRRNSDFEV